MWKTAITKVEANHIVTRGYRQEDLIGTIPFSSVVFLLWKGRMPNEYEGKMMDAILTSSIDHGATPPTCVASRTVASAGVPLPTAVAAGILAVGDVHGGAIENCAKILQKWVKKTEEEGKSIEEMASILFSELNKRKERMPGIGHRLHTKDPRTKRLFDLADKLKIAGEHIKFMKALESEFNKGRKKPLPVNVDGAIASVISDIGFDYRLGKAFFLLGRTAGLVAHVYEEQTREKPMRKLGEIETEYDGPWERNLT